MIYELQDNDLRLTRSNLRLLLDMLERERLDTPAAERCAGLIKQYAAELGARVPRPDALAVKTCLGELRNEADHANRVQLRSQAETARQDWMAMLERAAERQGKH